MKTDVCVLNNNANDPTQALDQVERCAIYEGLDKKQSLQLRLLAEEILGMARGVLGQFDAEFWVEAKNRSFTLYLDMSTNVDSEQRSDLISISTNRSNEATKGVMGKLRHLFEFALYGDNDYTTQLVTSTFFSPDAALSSSYDVGASYTWSLVDYVNAVKSTESSEEQWDELEKSTVAKLADDVKVSVFAHRVKMTITKAFK